MIAEPAALAAASQRDSSERQSGDWARRLAALPPGARALINDDHEPAERVDKDGFRISIWVGGALDELISSAGDVVCGRALSGIGHHSPEPFARRPRFSCICVERPQAVLKPALYKLFYHLINRVKYYLYNTV
jgi:hypothetical protein